MFQTFFLHIIKVNGVQIVVLDLTDFHTIHKTFETFFKISVLGK